MISAIKSPPLRGFREGEVSPSYGDGGVGSGRLWPMTPSPSYDEGTSPCRTPARGRKPTRLARQCSCANCGNYFWASVAHREPLAHVLCLLDLVDDGDREILAADAALALGVLDQLVETAAELAGALAGRDRGRRRDR